MAHIINLLYLHFMYVLCSSAWDLVQQIERHFKNEPQKQKNNKMAEQQNKSNVALIVKCFK